MPLSDHEQKLLDEIEQALYAEDPKFATHVRRSRSSQTRVRRDIVLCIVGGLLGLGLVLVGLVTTIIALSVVGFVLLVGSTGWAVQTLRNRSSSANSSSAPADPGTPSAPKQSGLRTRMEDRLRRRFDES